MADQTQTPDNDTIDAAETEIATLQARLSAAKARLSALRGQPPPQPQHQHQQQSPTQTQTPSIPTAPPSTHLLLLLADSALPLGSFAFSSGLESFLAHSPATTTTATTSSTTASPLTAFLPESISSFAATTLPFTLAAWRAPDRLLALDDEMDATILCAVARRASTSQGRALLALWERSFVPSGGTSTTSPTTTTTTPSSPSATAHDALALFSKTLRASSSSPFPPSAHLAPLFGAVCRASGLDAPQTAYVAVLSHARAVVSAAVRAGMLGPYLAQRVLAGRWLREMLERAVRREWDVVTEDAAQRVVALDLWMGRHELLYSRIFNS